MKLIALSVYGLDKPGIIYEISNILAENNVNIIDIEQSVLHGLFVMFIIGDIEKSKVSFEELKEQLEKKSKELKVN
ncbi:MAG TPA: ACT domain-containing protein, partial [Archaeoglobus profundus]|nr:ACT domain-containing protein [Archaeoglobus profundus]